MPISRREEHGATAFAMPVVWILVLLLVYWLASDWQALPRLISSTLAAIS